MKNLEKTESIVRNILDPRKKDFRVYVNVGGKKIRHEIPQDIKIRYIEYFLNKRWKEICGENLANNCAVEEIKSDILILKTKTSIYANELYMMKSLLLKKINKELEGRLKLKDIKFHTGKLSKINYDFSDDDVLEDSLVITKCPICGARMLSDNEICSVCEREKKNLLHSRIVELLKIQPWLSYDECNGYIKCNKIVFDSAKDELKNLYFERVRLGYADEYDKCMAVMLLTGKSAQDIDEKVFNNGIEFLRRNQNVSAFRV